MERHHYSTRVVRRRGKWRVTVPDLPADAPKVDTDHLGHAAPELIMSVAQYLGVNPTLVEVTVDLPARPARRTWRDRVTHTAVQVWGGSVALSGVYLAAGLAATLIASGVVLAALGVLKESGRI